jgi:hypothetical protein
VVTQDNNCATNGAPCGYPSVYKGCHYGNCTNNSGLPIQVSSLSGASSSWSINTAPGSWNASYDIWFNSVSSSTGQNDGCELMIWINHSGPPQPIGSIQATVSLSGATWDVWIGNVGWNVISYVRQNPTTSVNLDLRAFITDAQNRGQIQSSWWMTSVQAGFEPWSGGVGLASNAFSASFSTGGGTSPTPTPTPAPTAAPSATPAPTAATPSPTPNGSTTWAPSTFYARGSVVTYAGLSYQCRQSHTSQPGWEPPNAPALWSPL